MRALEQMARAAPAPAQYERMSDAISNYMMAWFFNHLHNPYPTAAEKEVISQVTRLTVRQLSNWFGNKRQKTLTSKHPPHRLDSISPQVKPTNGSQQKAASFV